MTEGRGPAARTPRFEWEQALRECPDVSLTTRAVLLTMATYATTTTGADVRPSLKRLAAGIGASRSTVTQHVGKAVTAGWLTPAGAPVGRPAVYALSIPTSQVGTNVPVANAGVTAATGTPERAPSKGDRHGSHRGDRGHGQGGDRHGSQGGTATAGTTYTDTSTQAPSTGTPLQGEEPFDPWAGFCDHDPSICPDRGDCELAKAPPF